MLKKNLAVTILTRDDTKASLQAFKESGATLVKVDYENRESLRKALVNVEAVVSAVSPAVMMSQVEVVHAAKEAGVQLFAPSEYGVRLTDGPNSPKRVVQDLLKKLELPYTIFYAGIFYEFTPIVSAVSPAVMMSQVEVVHAAKEAGVQLFAPSEYGVRLTDGPNSPKRVVQDLLKKLELPYTIFYAGIFYEFTPIALGHNYAEGKMNVVGEGNVPFSLTAAREASLQAFKESGATLVKVDYENRESLRKALVNVEAVVSAVSPAVMMSQVEVVHAAKEAGVQLFAPSEYGVRLTDGPNSPKHGVFTPTRASQGAMDSALHFQSQVQSKLAPLIPHSALVWVDDVILFAPTVEEFLHTLRVFFEIVHEANFKLNMSKSSLFELEVLWCGRLISSHGMRHDPARVSALAELPLPATVADLQYFVCATNWLHDSLPDYARVIAPLQDKLNAERQRIGRRNGNALNVATAWTNPERAAFDAVVALVADSALMTFPDPDAELLLFTDASAAGYSIILTQSVLELFGRWIADLDLLLDPLFLQFPPSRSTVGRWYPGVEHTTLQEALDAINSSEPWRCFFRGQPDARGNCAVGRAHPAYALARLRDKFVQAI
ncbi:Gag/polymerase/env Polyprotein [Phytophthora cinnamomi]|uniref:Gag/polymerase/env Polyprotein n=1 Tax=Phytophthora cinnamomi TaxID=4785 RepID=UPI00355993CD|nr:Gag/polymerase/env Polyprotein [Phytophthora cinnamomi]